MKSFLFAIVAVLLSLNVFGQTLSVDGEPFASCSICMECSYDNNGKQYSRIVVTSNLSMEQLDVKGAIVVNQKNEVGRKMIDFLPNRGQKIKFYAAQCQPLEVEISEFVTGGAEYQMHIVYEKNSVVEPVVVEPTPPSNNATVTHDDNDMPVMEENTAHPTTSIGGHEYVDLGLPSGTLWATCNIGANAPEEYGDYFAWGETDTKSTYDWSTYKYCLEIKGEPMFTKYCFQKKWGYQKFTDSRTALESSDDAATVNWGNYWCMPTRAQFQELKDECTWTWTTKNSKDGYEVKGPSGMTIFLPAAGCRVNESLYDVGFDGSYLSSSLDKDSPLSSSAFYFHSYTVNPDKWRFRDIGYSVRPVRCK